MFNSYQQIADGLKSDSLHKFLAILGVFLFFCPFMFTHTMLSGDYGLLLDDAACKKLSKEALSILNTKYCLYKIATQVHLLFSASLFVAGGVSFYYGIKGWLPLQKNIENTWFSSFPNQGKSTEAENLEKISSEILEEEKDRAKNRPASKTAEETSIDTVANHDVSSPSGAFSVKDTESPVKNPLRAAPLRQRYREYELIEQRIIEKLKEELSPHYEVHHNVKVSELPLRIVDAIACSKIGMVDILYEIKMFAGSLTQDRLKSIASSLNTYRELYTLKTGRNCEGRLIFVMHDSVVEGAKKLIRKLQDESHFDGVAVAIIAKELLTMENSEYVNGTLTWNIAFTSMTNHTNSSVQPMEKEEIKKALYSMGIAFFINYYFILRLYNNRKCISAITEDFSASSKKSRVSTAKRILNTKSHLIALRYIVLESENVQTDIMKKAEEILRLEQ